MIYLGQMVKCALCGNKLDKSTGIRYKDKNYHPECYEINKEKEDLYTYICELFCLKAPGPRNFQYIKRFKENNGYTYKGMLYTLKYFYEVKKSNKDKANNSIGIIPYVYDEAKEYYSNLDFKNKKIKKIVEQQIETPKETIKITAPRRKQKRDEYCLEDI